MNTPKQQSSNFAYDISKNVISKGEAIDIDAINQSIESILMTTYGERIFNLGFGSSLSLQVFEIQDQKSGEKLLNEIANSIRQWDDRVIIIEDKMQLIIDQNSNSMFLSIPYSVKNSNLKSIFQKKLIS